MDDEVSTLCAALGVPRRVFIGVDKGSESGSRSVAFIRAEQARTDALRSRWEDTIPKIVEKNLPELSWEPIFLCSPRGRLWKRRANPVRIVWG